MKPCYCVPLAADMGVSSLRRGAVDVVFFILFVFFALGILLAPSFHPVMQVSLFPLPL